MTETNAQSERDAAWWAAWREADFTWTGLAKDKPWEGWVVTDDGYVHRADDGRLYRAPMPEAGEPARVKMEERPASLQDYWRVDPATSRLRSDDEMSKELVRAEGQPVYHRAHLPLFYENGAPTGKAEWPDNALDELVNPRLLAAEETKDEVFSYSREPKRADARAQFQGGVWLCAAAAPLNKVTPLSVRYGNSAFVRDARFARMIFCGDARFERAIFCGDAGFRNSTFSGQANFENATFLRNARFGGTKFLSKVRFEKVTFSVDASFKFANFSHYASFENAKFSGDALFEKARFSSEVRFGGSTFFGNADFESATFSGAGWFHGTMFTGHANFQGATFARHAGLQGATFCRYAAFHRVTFLGHAGFEGANFKGRPNFEGASFRGYVRFTGAVFENQASFRKIQWVSETDEEGNAWSQTEEQWRRAFYTAEFKGPVDFEGAGARAFAAFDGARLERGITLDKPKASTVDAAFRRELRFFKNFPKRQSISPKRRWFELIRPNPDEQVGLEALEGGCRVLKQAMASASNTLREQQFYRYELIARRKQKATPWSERVFSHLYAWTANYGASIGRPFVAVLALVVLFACGYWLSKVGPQEMVAAFCYTPGEGLDGQFLNALEFSFSRVFPFGAFEDVSKRWIDAFENPDTVWTIVLRVAASAQSAFALALVFVLGLGVRRKFQIT